MTRCRLLLVAVALVVTIGTRLFAASDSLVLVDRGKSDFSICIPADCSVRTTANIDTLRNYIQRTSGVSIPVTSAYSAKKHQIVIEIAKSHDKKYNTATLGHDGFRIWTSKGSLYLTAHTDYGLQNAIYTFLETYLGCRMFSPAVIVVPNKQIISLPSIDDTQIPPITFRMQDFKDSAYAAWHKLNLNADFGLFVHTFKILVPPEKYFKDHPEYFSLINGNRTPNGQLCLSNPEVFRIVVDELRSRMKARPQATFWSVSQNDTYIPCECDACRAIDSAEGSPSGSILTFVNKVAEQFPDKTISTLAYEYSRQAPKHIKPLPNVNIMLCSIECNRSKPLAEDPLSTSFVTDVENWGKLTHNIFLWDYVIQFRNLVSPFPNLRILQPNMQFFVGNGITSVFEQGLPVMYGEFAELRAYLISKLLWNPNINVDSVMNDFLSGFYGEAAPYIRQYIDTMHDALQRSGENLNVYGYPWPSTDGYLSPRMLDCYDSLLNRAESAVVDQPDILVRVQTAHLPVQFALLEQAKVNGAGERGFFATAADGSLSIIPRMDSLLSLFVAHCKQANMPRLWEHGTSPDEYWTSSRAFVDGSTRKHLARGKPAMLSEPASPKYHNGEASALTDGFKGWNDYHMHWLGFEGNDMDATVDLGNAQTVSSIGTDFLQDIGSWVFMPLEVEFTVSADGKTFRSVGKVVNSTPAERDGAVIASFNVTFEPTTARFIRVKASSMKTCPTWHQGSGGKAWIFIDEITVQ